LKPKPLSGNYVNGGILFSSEQIPFFIAYITQGIALPSVGQYIVIFV